MWIKVQYWNERESLLDDKWFDSVAEAMKFTEELKALDDITAITVSQILYQYES